MTDRTGRPGVACARSKAPADAGLLLERLHRALPDDLFRPTEARYLEEPRGQFHGRALAVLAPRTTDEVAGILRCATGLRLPVVPYGGGTGLVGGQVLPDGPPPLLVTLERMTAIRAIHPEEGVLIAEAGAVLADVQAAAAEHGMLFPLSMASQGSSRIGGNLATNCGGVGVLRYGNARELCLGLEAVLPDGSVLHGLKRLRKDNTGYDLRNLLIGSEGTLGIITAAVLRLFPAPASESAAILAVPDPAAALCLLGLARRRLGEGISAFELMHRQGMAFLAATMPQIRQPFAPPPDWSVLVDVGLHGAADAEAALTGLFEAGFAEGLVTDGVIASSEAQRADFWTLRESIPEANRLTGAIASHDVSLPLGALPGFIAEAGAAIAALGPYRINCFGHVGDGNLHYNVFPPAGEDKAGHAGRRTDITRAVHDLVQAHGGSISAEHGIGRLKRADLQRYGDPAKLAAMRAIKAALDPLNLMNPGAVLARP
jgi:FAD/FMN-containing dehydrogenase